MSSAFFLILINLSNSSGSRIENYSGIDFLIKEVIHKNFCFSELGDRQFVVEPSLFCGLDRHLSFSRNVVDNTFQFLFGFGLFISRWQCVLVGDREINGCTG